MTALVGRVAVVTGGGRGLGRRHALELAREGARVVVNDLGCAIDGAGRDPNVAEAVAAEIVAAGGEAIANADDVADWDGGHRLIAAAVEAFGDLHVLVNNAGILRDRYLVDMSEDEWDGAVRTHLKGHFVPTRAAAAYWRSRGAADDAVIINTTSTSGLFGNAGQANYSAAKAGVVGLTLVVAKELARFGVRCNAIAPLARTRLTESVPALAARLAPPATTTTFDPWDPANASAVVAWLATADCSVSGEVFLVDGGEVRVLRSWAPGEGVKKEGRWTPAELAAELGPRLAASATP